LFSIKLKLQNKVLFKYVTIYLLQQQKEKQVNHHTISKKSFK